MRMFYALLILCAGMAMGTTGCASSAESVRTPADTQPRSYMNDVTNPMNQPEVQRTGAIRY